MAYTNLTKLTNIDPINLTFDNLTNPVTAVTTLRDTAQNEVGNFWFIGSIVIIFLVLTWWFYRPDKTILLDLTRSILVSSAWCFFISVGFLLSGWITTITPVLWFATLFTGSVVAAMKLKTKGL